MLNRLVCWTRRKLGLPVHYRMKAKVSRVDVPLLGSRKTATGGRGVGGGGNGGDASVGGVGVATGGKGGDGPNGDGAPGVVVVNTTTWTVPKDFDKAAKISCWGAGGSGVRAAQGVYPFVVGAKGDPAAGRRCLICGCYDGLHDNDKHYRPVNK